MPVFSRTLSARTRASGLLALTALALSVPAQAQGTYNGSLYSRFGLGERIPSASSQAAAMGGGGVGLTSLSYAQVANPASLGNQVLTRVTMGAYVQGLSIKDASDASASRSEGLFGGVEFAFPLIRQKMGVGVRFTPDTRLAYGVRQTGQLLLPGNPTGDDTLRYRVRTEGSGGLNHLDVGFGAAVGKRLLVGASAGALFGVLEDGRRTTFVNANGASLTNYDEQNVVTTTRLAGLAATAGVLARFDSLGGSGRGLHVGATVSLPTRLKGRRTLTLGESLDRDTLTTSQRGDVTVPLGASIGLAFYANPRLTLIADARYEPWSQFESDFSFAGYSALTCANGVCLTGVTSCPNGVCSNVATNNFHDRTRLSAGAEYLPSGNRVFASFWQRVAYRVGAYYDNGYVTPTGVSSDVATVGLTAGLSLPSLFLGSRADVNLELGQRGRAEGVGVQDRFVRLGLVISLGERWFDRRRLD